MEISRVRKGLYDTMARAKRDSAERRARTDAATRAFDSFLNRIAVPLIRQVVNVLRSENYAFSVSTPASSVRLTSDKSAEDFVDISLDTAGDAPRVMGRVSWSRGRRVVDAERVLASGDPELITEDELFEFLLKELEPFVER
jgi:hypothetical protein